MYNQDPMHDPSSTMSALYAPRENYPGESVFARHSKTFAGLSRSWCNYFRRRNAKKGVIGPSGFLFTRNFLLMFAYLFFTQVLPVLVWVAGEVVLLVAWLITMALDALWWPVSKIGR